LQRKRKGRKRSRMMMTTTMMKATRNKAELPVRGMMMMTMMMR
jgi:hypothetical protein